MYVVIFYVNILWRVRCRQSMDIWTGTLMHHILLSMNGRCWGQSSNYIIAMTVIHSNVGLTGHVYKSINGRNILEAHDRSWTTHYSVNPASNVKAKSCNLGKLPTMPLEHHW